jgi:hypothetical protein
MLNLFGSDIGDSSPQLAGAQRLENVRVRFNGFIHARESTAGHRRVVSPPLVTANAVFGEEK